MRVVIVHKKKRIAGDTAGYDLVITGHSHKYEEKETENGFFLNPGSCGPRRFSQPVTMAVVEVEEESGKFRVIKQDICQSEEPSGKAKTPETVFSEKTLSAILRDVDRGKSVSEIAGKYQIDSESAAQICRLYLTHPGITAAGIREKMGLPRDR